MGRPLGSKNSYKYKVSEESRHNISLSNKLHKTGDKNHNWKGDNVGYRALHRWVRRHLVKPNVCQECGQKKRLDLANITGFYNRELYNWLYLCRKCHMEMDGRLLKQIELMKSYGRAKSKML